MSQPEEPLVLDLLRLGDWVARAWFGLARNQEGRPAGRPVEFARTFFRALLARDAELGMHDADVSRCDLERRIFRRVEPLEHAFAGLDPPHGREPEAP